jgi:Transposase, Mutator family
MSRPFERTSTSALRLFSTGRSPATGPNATYLKVREDGRNVSVAAMIATSVNADGRAFRTAAMNTWREVLAAASLLRLFPGQG